MKKILLVTFSDNADHQDTVFGMYEELRKKNKQKIFLLTIKNPKVNIKPSEHTWFVDCPKRPGITKKTFDFRLLLKIIRWIRKEKFDVIYFESLHTWNLPIMMFSGNARTYQVIHEVIPHEGDRQVKMVDLMNKVVCKLADIIVLRNKKYINEMLKRYRVKAKKIKYMELWRRYPSYTEAKHSGRILFFGRLNPYKGADKLLEIVRQCSEYNFDVVGRVDPQMQYIANELAKQPNVNLHDYYVSDKEMKNYFVNCDWVILPYNSASQSGVIIDAYKYSRPVISFEVGAIVEQIIDGKSGYLIEPGNVLQFVEKLHTVMNFSEEKYNEMSKYAYDYGCKKYSVAGAVERFGQLVEE